MIIISEKRSKAKKIFLNYARDKFSGLEENEFSVESFPCIVRIHFELANFETSSSYMGKANLKISIVDIDTQQIYSLSKNNIPLVIDLINSALRERTSYAIGFFKTLSTGSMLEVIQPPEVD